MALVHLANEKSFESPADVSMLDAARASGIVLEHSCKTGRCGTCRARVVHGATKQIGNASGLSVSDEQAGYVLTCTAAAVGSDVRLDIEDISLLANFPSRTTPCRIEIIEYLAPDVLRLVFRFPPKATPNYLPGQYLDVIGAGGVRRSYSLAAKPAPDGKVELHVRQVVGGAMSNYWFGSAKVGDLLRIDGPKGTFFLRDVTDLDLIFLATGTGIAPVKAMLEGLACRADSGLPRSITVFWGGRVMEDLYLNLANMDLPHFEFVPVLSRANNSWTGAVGHVQKALMQRQPDLANSVVYACGSQAMIDGATSELIGSGLPAKRFYSDAFVSSSI